MAATKMIRKFLADENGATAIEYGLIAALIALAIISGVGATGGGVAQRWNENALEIADWLNR